MPGGKVSKITAKSRVDEFQRKHNFKLHESGGVLFCSVCNQSLDHTRTDVVVRHFEGVRRVMCNVGWLYDCLQ